MLAFRRALCHGDGVVLPLVPFLLGRVTCTECGKDEVAMRASFEVGRLRKCPHCGKRYRVTEVRNVANRGTGRRPAPKKAKK